MKKILILFCLLPLSLFGQQRNIHFVKTSTGVMPMRGEDSTFMNIPDEYLESLDLVDITGLGYINVADYGATGDGSDETSLLQNAFDAGAGRTVIIPTGTYHITSPLVISSNTVITGLGPENTIIFADTSFTDDHGMLTFEPNAKYITIRDLCINGNMYAFLSKKGEHFGINTWNDGNTDASYITVKNVEITKTSEFAVWCRGKNWSFDDCYFHRIGDTLNAGGVFAATDGFKMVNCLFDSIMQHGIYYYVGSNIVISNSIFRNCGKIGNAVINGPNVRNGSGISMRADSNIVITGNSILYNQNAGLNLIWAEDAINYMRNVVVTGNLIAENKGDTANFNAQVGIVRVKDLVFSGNVIGPSTSADAKGIRLYGVNRNISITGNNISGETGIGLGSSLLENINIKDNFFNVSKGRKMTCGIVFEDYATTGKDIYIMGNTGDSLTTGIQINPDWVATGIIIKNNEFTNCTNKIVNLSSATAHNIEYKGSSAFTTTADRKAIFIDGLNTDYDATVTADQGSDSVHPVAEDLMSAYCKADSLIVKRVAGTGGTSGLKFKYVVNND